MDLEQTNTTFDLGYLTLFDSNPLKYKCDLTDQSINKNLEEQGLMNIKRLVHAFYALKTQKDKDFDAIPDEHQVIDFSQSKFDLNLPAGKSVFPRHKKIPEQKALTRWEKFAQDKGIQKTKRSRLVFDEITKSWVPRWGPGSIKKIQHETDIIRPVKPGEDPNEDPFDKKAKERKLQQEKQKYNELRNKMEAKGLLQKEVPQTMKQMNKKNKDKKATKKALEIAQGSTASMGMFDKKAHKEEPEIKKKRKNNAPVFTNVKEENKRNLDILEQITRSQK